MENVQHTREEILNKDFKKTRIGTGYDITDVDAYLDEIISDYQAFQTNINELNNQNQKLKDQVAELTKQVSAAPTSTPKASPAPAVNTNMDILKRLSNLERRVFGASSDQFKRNQEKIDDKPEEVEDVIVKESSSQSVE
ncbi:cell division regulator GpsB [Weissella paramesenteroides]|uniref:cell division regulator GpsB n=1 Tax=Weissella paramesenteroides TaxID=1249 RepID=UPI00123ABC53|nr:cell division regulator GpsB [Weissella paramesenteroides]KAA8441025.1 cell division regulator GpsB [Weissella paramesenteroides]KAA8441197.1 cell division regulator GpsB [Weissella paramesenteroides]KAA8443457.1 cell division regulator GpsB [Weissella paramesenteroides]KAA8447745.1 cell division regulator GpsB [Weissella paramesenteroides]KAA8449652.1 cell division regulator GpsB [Weissella paramesenteroides]